MKYHTEVVHDTVKKILIARSRMATAKRRKANFFRRLWGKKKNCNRLNSFNQYTHCLPKQFSHEYHLQPPTCGDKVNFPRDFSQTIGEMRKGPSLFLFFDIWKTFFMFLFFLLFIFVPDFCLLSCCVFLHSDTLIITKMNKTFPSSAPRLDSFICALWLGKGKISFVIFSFLMATEETVGENYQDWGHNFEFFYIFVREKRIKFSLSRKWTHFLCLLMMRFETLSIKNSINQRKVSSKFVTKEIKW